MVGLLARTDGRNGALRSAPQLFKGKGCLVASESALHIPRPRPKGRLAIMTSLFVHSGTRTLSHEHLLLRINCRHACVRRLLEMEKARALEAEQDDGLSAAEIFRKYNRCDVLARTE